MLENTVVLVYRASKTFSNLSSIWPVSLLKYGTFGLPGSFLLGGGRLAEIQELS